MQHHIMVKNNDSSQKLFVFEQYKMVFIQVTFYNIWLLIETQNGSNHSYEIINGPAMSNIDRLVKYKYIDQGWSIFIKI